MPQSNSIKALQILHTAMMMGQVLFAAIAVFIVYKNGRLVLSDAVDKALQVVVVLIALPLIIFGMKWYQKKVLQIRNNNNTPAQKFEEYRATIIKVLAMVEAPAILSIIAFLLTGNWAFIAMFAMLLLFFASLQPTKIKLLLLLALSEKDLEEV
jgi:hypothetical protein